MPVLSEQLPWEVRNLFSVAAEGATQTAVLGLALLQGAGRWTWAVRHG
jgi:hypothetical protein